MAEIHKLGAPKQASWPSGEKAGMACLNLEAPIRQLVWASELAEMAEIEGRDDLMSFMLSVIYERAKKLNEQWHEQHAQWETAPSSND
jgi:hypothetical protein